MLTTFIDRSRCHYLQQTVLIMVKVTYHKFKILAMIYILKFPQSVLSSKSQIKHKLSVARKRAVSSAIVYQAVTSALR